MSVTGKGVGRSAGPSVAYVETDASVPSKAEAWFVYAVLLATAVIPGLQEKYGLLNQSAIQIFWALAYVVAARQLWQMRDRVLPLVRRTAPLWILVAFMFVTTVWSVNPTTTMIDSIELLGTTLIGFYVATRFTLSELLRIVAMMFATTAALSIVLVFFNPGWGRADWGAGPWQGIYPDKNLLGAAAALAIISQVALFFSVRGGARWPVAIVLLLSGIVLIGSNSATAFTNCVFVIFAMLVASACRSPKFGGFARVATILGVLVAIGAVLVFGITPDSVLEALGRESNLTGRADFWPYLQQAIADRPALGFGFDAFFGSPTGDGYLSEYVVQAGGWSPYHAHNSYLQTLLDAGYVGLGLLVLQITIAFAKSIGYFSRVRNFACVWPLAIVLFLTGTSFTETYYLDYNTLEWILFVAAIVYPLRLSLRKADAARAG